MTEKNSFPNRAVVIMAGGTGTRLWPLSRQAMPKQFHSLISEKTLLRETFDRVKHLVPKGHIFVCTSKSFVDTTRALLPEISQEHIIIEPVARGTYSAIALSASMLIQKNPDIVIATIAADHAIENPEEFSKTLLAAFTLVETHHEKIVTIGINPTTPDTGLGYIKIGSEFGSFEGKKSYFIDAFKEKPVLKVAETYLASFEYLWNAGYFIFSGTQLLKWAQQFTPDTAMILKNFSFPLSDEDTKKYIHFQNHPIETILIEQLPSESSIVIPAALKWSDIGSWDTLFHFLKHKNHSESIIQGNAITLQSEKNFIHTSPEKLIALVGVNDLIVVDTPDALLILNKDEAEKMKELISIVKHANKDNYL